MNKTFAFLFTSIIMVVAAIMPCCLGLNPPPGTYSGVYSTHALSASPSITFLPNNGSSLSSYYVGDETIHGFLYNQGNTSASSPQGLFLYNSGNLTLGLSVGAQEAYSILSATEIAEEQSIEVLTSISYKVSWLEQSVNIYAENISSPNALSSFAYNLSLGNIPDGQQQIIVTAVEEGYIWGVTNYYSFSASTSAVFNFDVVPLSISVTSPVEGQVFNSSKVPLDFNVNESPTWLGFSLNNLAIKETDGNTTLTDFANGTQLTNGHYSLTVYSNDSFGNIGKSAPINFTISEPEPTYPFPIAIVDVVSVLVVVVVCIGLAVLFYRRHQKNR